MPGPAPSQGAQLLPGLALTCFTASGTQGPAIWTLPALGACHARLTGAQPAHLLTVIPYSAPGVTAAGWGEGEKPPDVQASMGSHLPAGARPAPARCGTETSSPGHRCGWTNEVHSWPWSLTGAATPAISDDATEVPKARLTAVALDTPHARAAGALARGWVTGATIGAVRVALAHTCKAR